MSFEICYRNATEVHTRISRKSSSPRCNSYTRALFMGIAKSYNSRIKKARARARVYKPADANLAGRRIDSGARPYFLPRLSPRRLALPNHPKNIKRIKLRCVREKEKPPPEKSLLSKRENSSRAVAPALKRNRSAQSTHTHTRNRGQ